MSCCGERRAQLKARLQAQQGPAHPDGPAPAPRRLCYRSGIAVVVTGPVTGRVYSFAAGRVPLEVDADDALALLESGRYDAA
jgi:hypothetical protein